MDYKSNKLLERFILFSLSTSFIIILLYILNKAVISTPLIEIEFAPVNLYSYAIIFVLGFIYSSALDYFIGPKTNGAIHIIILISCLVAVILLSFSIQQSKILFFLIPACIIHYIISAYMNGFFLFHEEFMYSLEGMSGEKLRSYLFHNNLAAGDFGKYLKKLQFFLATLGAVALLFLFGGKFLGLSYNPLLIIIMIYFYTMLFITFILTGIYNREIYYAFLGFNTILKNPSKLFLISILILLISALAGISLSSNRAFIKIKPLEFKENDSIKIENPKIFIPQLEYQEVRPEESFSVRNIEEKDFSQLWHILDIAAKILMGLGGVFLITLLIIHLVKNGSFRKLFKEGLLAKFFKKLLQDFKDFIKVLFKIKVEHEDDYSKIQGELFKESVKSFLFKNKKSHAKRSEIDKLTRVFIALIDWGSRRKITYTENLAPAEYTNLIKEYFAKNDRSSFFEYTETAGYLFEKALYDKELLSQEEEKNFRKAVKSITSFTLQ
ncbi:MAG: hypothetical protein K5829_12020 [Treponema sp.]|nr:hypothetical protein [Treponema sp.]